MYAKFSGLGRQFFSIGIDSLCADVSGGQYGLLSILIARR